MSPRPTGRLSATNAGTHLVLERHSRAPIEDVWQSVTDYPSMKEHFVAQLSSSK